MAWTNKQKAAASMACKAAKLSDQQRRDMVLRSFVNAHYKGDVTSTSPKLTDEDFEQFMAVMERYAGGQLLGFARDYWVRHAEDRWARMRHRVERIDAALQAAGIFSPGSLAGWIEKRVCGGSAKSINALQYHELLALILGLESFARQKRVAIPRVDSARDQTTGTDAATDTTEGIPEHAHD